MFYWIYDIPTWKLVLMLSAFFIGFTWLGTIFIRPFIRLFVRRQMGGNDLVGYILSCFCVFYGLLLGLVAVAAYQNFSNVEATVGREASALGALYRDVSSYPEPTRSALQSVLREYTRYTIEEAWPAQQRGEVRGGGVLRITAFQEVLRTFEPQTKSEEILHAETYHQFNQFLELRNLRRQSVTTGIPAILWYVVVMGAFLTILLVWLFDMRFIPQLFLGGLLAFFVATMISLIAAMDNPFRGEVSVSSDPFKQVYQSLMASGSEPIPTDREPEQVQLKSAGATFPAVLYRDWFQRFHAQNPETSVVYDAVGSGEGVKRFLAGQVDFAGTDTALTGEQMAQVRDGAQHIPAVAGMVGLVYNLPGVGTLRLSREAYAGIFLGKITRWDDPVIAKCNPGTSLPQQDIRVVGRLDSSGTTYLLTNHLSAISEDWKEKYGATSLVSWPNGVLRQQGNEKVAETVKATPGAIGYVDMGTALREKLPAAWLENKAGAYVEPRLLNGTLALQEAKMVGDLRVYLPDPEGGNAYPIVGYSWLVIHRHYDNPETARAIKHLLRSCLLEGQKDCERLGYVPLPANVVSLGILALEQAGQ